MQSQFAFDMDFGFQQGLAESVARGRVKEWCEKAQGFLLSQSLGLTLASSPGSCEDQPGPP
jgi:hypothetical protein